MSLRAAILGLGNISATHIKGWGEVEGVEIRGILADGVVPEDEALGFQPLFQVRDDCRQ